MELNPKSMIAKVEAAGTDKGIALTPGSMIGNRKVNAEDLSARGAERKANIDEARAKRKAEFIAKAMGQANARIGKNPLTAEQYETLALIRHNILSILPQELVGLCAHNLPTDEMALDGTNPVLTAFLKPSDTGGGMVGTYWGIASSKANSNYSFSIKSYNSTGMIINGGRWTHRYTAAALDAESQEEMTYNQTGPHSFSAGANYVYVEMIGGALTWGITNSYPVSSTTYLRRAIAYVNLTSDGGTLVPSAAPIGLNAGDIHSW